MFLKLSGKMVAFFYKYVVNQAKHCLVLYDIGDLEDTVMYSAKMT